MAPFNLVRPVNEFVMTRRWQKHHTLAQYGVCHWRRQLWGTGARAPSTSDCVIFQVTSEPHKLWHSTAYGCLSSKNYSLSFVPPRTKSWRRHRRLSLTLSKKLCFHVNVVTRWQAAVTSCCHVPYWSKIKSQLSLFFFCWQAVILAYIVFLTLN